MSIFEYDEEKEIGRIRKEEREAGREIGEEIGEKRGLTQGAVNTIMILKGIGISPKDTAAKLTEQFGFTKKEAEALVDEHWGK